MDYVTYYKFKHKTDAENFIQELIDCEVNNFNFTPIIVRNNIRWIVKLYNGKTFSFSYDYETLKSKELEYRKKFENKVTVIKTHKEVV